MVKGCKVEKLYPNKLIIKHLKLEMVFLEKPEQHSNLSTLKPYNSGVRTAPKQFWQAPHP
ncbi:MAG: hypothetical protein C0154_16800 [Mucilaginibacter sp.]|nr:MAG: hypothetical protein BGO48_12245 [Mucilaginibacter sp. 44-25]PLW88402.1 MAG: hypothetical protein C0154_16800 [Mucilaginibacter sp.]